MNLPNKLTMARILLVPVFMVFASMTRYNTEGYTAAWYLAAGVVFAVASFTDYLDGHLARKWHLITDFGKFARPAGRQAADHGRLFVYDAGRGVFAGGAGGHPGPGVCGVGPADGGGRRQGRQSDRGQHVGQGQDGAANAEHHLLLLCRRPGRAHRYHGGLPDLQRPCAGWWLRSPPFRGIKYLVDNRHFINTAK